MHNTITDWKKIAQSGPTVDGRNIDPQWLHDMAELYNPEKQYTALMWPEHSRFSDNLGKVVELKVEDEGEHVALYARLVPNRQLLYKNSNGQGLFTSIEVLEDFAGTGKFYLGGLGITDSPASLGTTELRFSCGANSQTCEIYPGTELSLEDHSEEEAPGWFKKFAAKFRHDKHEEEDSMTDEQIKQFAEAVGEQVKTAVQPIVDRFSALELAPEGDAPDGEGKPAPDNGDDSTKDFAALVGSEIKKALEPFESKFSTLEQRMSAGKPGTNFKDISSPADDVQGMV